MLSRLPTSGPPCLCAISSVSVYFRSGIFVLRGKLTSAKFGLIKAAHSSTRSFGASCPLETNVFSSASIDTMAKKGSTDDSTKRLNLGDEFPDFTVACFGPKGKDKIHFHGEIAGSWAILFSHPADYTPVCTTELARVVELIPEFAQRNCKVFALSCNDPDSHEGWSKDVMAYAKRDGHFPYRIIADEKRELAVKLGMVDPDEKDSKGLALTCRAVFIIGPDKRLKLSILYPATTGRNFDEILRVLDSLQLTATKKVATPVDWKRGEKCMVLPNLSDDEAKKLFPDFKEKKLPSGKSYLRLTPQP